MVHAELVIDILSEIEERGALDAVSSIEQLIASQSTLGQQVAQSRAGRRIAARAGGPARVG